MAHVDFSLEAAAAPCRASGLGGDPRLDALRRASTAAWRGNGALSSTEAAAFVAAGFRPDQLVALVASIGNGRGAPGAGAAA